MAFSEKFIYLIVLIALAKMNKAVNTGKKQDSLRAKCLLPMEPGPCHMNLKRFYYNATTDTCEEFKFGGCMGNENKFAFKQICEVACKVLREIEKQQKQSKLNLDTAFTSKTTARPRVAHATIKTLTSTPTSVTTITQNKKRS